MRPTRPPLGLHLTRVARTVSRAFDDALSEAGGSLPAWLVLLNLKTGRVANQRQLAEVIGLHEATLSHHLNGMDEEGLISRRRDTTNRRIHVLELTDAGNKAFDRLRQAALAFDQDLRRGITAEETATLEALLTRLEHNVSSRGSR